MMLVRHLGIIGQISMKRIDLDLSSVELYGWEYGQCQEMVFSMLEGIALGDEFPLVHIRNIEQSGFVIYYPGDGGHHRAIAHYLFGAPLRCLLDDEPSYKRKEGLVSVEDFGLFSSPRKWELEKRKDTNFRPIRKDSSRLIRDGVNVKMRQ